MADKSKRASVTGIVRRTYPVQMEVRAKDNASGVSTITGYASAVDQPYEMWDFLGSYAEVVRSGAFAKTLAEHPQVQLLLNHGGLAMAYTKAGTLRLSEDSAGLHMEADVTGARSDVQDMLLALQDGSVDEMSFAFRVTRQLWSPDYDQRDILEVDLHRGDVSVVNFGANPATSVAPALRAADFDQLGEDDARALMERLQRRFAPAEPEPPAGHPLSLYLAQAEALGL
ncbi:HK97 family phage prohead protease [Streptomyces jumonjinensis]|uniref:HK97 family phage prohead protease n=1 Tax=Streptomyces jumonjinensis TaxID=1945 RepID=A0A646KMK6_STRJU|nr:HK97 family phage prohead protease [Streptomyces jumonjinensis]MQT03171.1 HK97 family phage prohead protease [Streptomyces jumonjinensis]